VIETLIPPTTLDNDVAVMKIIHLLGQLTPKDIGYLLAVVNNVHKTVAEDIDGRC
jgi:hypothetical protein